MDQLIISGLKVSTRIGVHAWEQAIQQQLLIDLLIPCQVDGVEDTLSAVLNYDAICQTITQLVEGQSFQLIETVANQIAIRLKQDFGLTALEVTVHKPQAIPFAKNIAIKVVR